MSVFLGLGLLALGLPAGAVVSPDAIAIRVFPNPNHYSALRWYDEHGFSGSPQSLVVDGYEAVRDGRSVYVDAANIVNGNLYTNIYLISYNQDPEGATVDIFSQVLSHWKFNTNITGEGRCTEDGGFICTKDEDCANVGKGYCQRQAGSQTAVKAEVVRDTLKLADLSDIDSALNNYKKVHGYFPKLSAGSYIAGKTVSTWPSWQETLAQALGTPLPTGPINKMGRCKADDQENKKYNPVTCWDETEKKFATQLPDLPAGSQVYMYIASPDGSSYQSCGEMESGLVKTMGQGACPGSQQVGYVQNLVNHPPLLACGSFVSYPHEPLIGYVSASDPDKDGLTNWAVFPFMPADWTSWTDWQWKAGADGLKLEDTALANQKKISAAAVGKAGSYKFKISVADDKGAVTTQECPVTIKPGDPIIDPIGDQTVAAGGNLAFTIKASEPTRQYPLQFSFEVKDKDNTTVAPLTCSSVTSNPSGEPDGKFYCYVNQTINYKAEAASNNYTVTVTATDSKGDQSQPVSFNLKVTNNLPVIGPINCPTSVRINNPYSCNLTATDPDGQPIKGFNFSGLPAGLIGSMANGQGLISGSPTMSGAFNIIINAIDLFFGVSLPADLPLTVNTYCGDGVKQTPNMEKTGGPANDGNEACDGQDGVATSPADSSATKQYACAPNCTFKAGQGGVNSGWCGDGICQGGTETCSNCSADCGACCVPNCAGKICGDDGCGGSCGACSAGTACYAYQKCCTLSAAIQVCADNEHYTYVNGQFVSHAADWSSVQSFGAPVQVGKNVIAVEGVNPDWSNSGDWYGFSVILNVGSGCIQMTTAEVNKWKCVTGTPPANWVDANFDDSSWPTAVYGYPGSSGIRSGNYLTVPQIWANGASKISTVYCRYDFNIN